MDRARPQICQRETVSPPPHVVWNPRRVRGFGPRGYVLLRETRVHMHALMHDALLHLVLVLCHAQ